MELAGARGAAQPNSNDRRRDEGNPDLRQRSERPAPLDEGPAKRGEPHQHAKVDSGGISHP